SEAGAGRWNATGTGPVEKPRGTFSVLCRTPAFQVREREAFAGGHPSLVTRTLVQGKRRFVATFRDLNQPYGVVREAGRRLLQSVGARRDGASLSGSSREAEIAGPPERRLGLRSIADAASRDKQSQIVAGPTRLTVAAVGLFQLAELVARVAAPIVASLLPERQ